MTKITVDNLEAIAKVGSTLILHRTDIEGEGLDMIGHIYDTEEQTLSSERPVLVMLKWMPYYQLYDGEITGYPEEGLEPEPEDKPRQARAGASYEVADGFDF